jgi:hypothetical protein
VTRRLRLRDARVVRCGPRSGAAPDEVPLQGVPQLTAPLLQPIALLVPRGAHGPERVWVRPRWYAGGGRGGWKRGELGDFGNDEPDFADVQLPGRRVRPARREELSAGRVHICFEPGSVGGDVPGPAWILDRSM